MSLIRSRSDSSILTLSEPPTTLTISRSSSVPTILDPTALDLAPSLAQLSLVDKGKSLLPTSPNLSDGSGSSGSGNISGGSVSDGSDNYLSTWQGKNPNKSISSAEDTDEFEPDLHAKVGKLKKKSRLILEATCFAKTKSRDIFSSGFPLVP